MRRTAISLLLVAALVVAARLPFVLAGDRFFNSDEAVEGLMARHVLQGEFPIFMWGQHYKGVPEVYLDAAAFKLFGPSVVALKATTLALFVAFACVQFVLLELLFSTTVAWIASLLLVACPPVFVVWSLSANAEMVLTMLAGTVMLLGVERWRATESLGALAAASAAIGFGLWVQQFVVYYLVAAALAALVALGPSAREPGGIARFIRAPESPPWRRRALHVALGVGLLHLLLGTIAFFGGGWQIRVLGIAIAVNHAQKQWRFAAIWLLAWGGVRWFERHAANRSVSVRRLIVPVAALLLGYAPAVAYRVTAGGGVPTGRMDIRQLFHALPTIATAIVPMLVGLKGPGVERLPISAGWLVLVGVTLAASYLGSRRRPRSLVFHLFVPTTPAIFLASGAFVDAQSYRYLIPMLGALPAVYATGIESVGRWSRLAAGGLCAGLLAFFTLQQVAWYRSLGPDTQSRAILACASARHIRYASADYWLSYKLTFLSDEMLIVAPVNELDRYPEYTRLVRAQPGAPLITAGPDSPDITDRAGRDPCDRFFAAGG